MEKQFQELYNTLKKLGFQVEFKVNEEIQNSLNKKEIIKQLHEHSHSYTKVVEGLKELIEMISIPLNLPTKNDVANVAKLTLQNEEKIDSIEEQLKVLNRHLREQNVGVSPTNVDDTPTDENLNTDKKRKRDKKRILLKSILESTSTLGSRKG